MAITQWCSEHDIKPANYYYRRNEVRKACLESLPVESIQQQVVPISQELLGQKEVAPNVSGLDVSVNGASGGFQCLMMQPVSKMFILSPVTPIYGLGLIGWLFLYIQK